MKTTRLLLFSAFILMGPNVFGQDIRGYFFNGAYPSQKDPFVATIIGESKEGGVPTEINKMIDGLGSLQTTKRVFVRNSWGYGEWVTSSETKHNLLYTKDAIYSITQNTKSLIDRNGSVTDVKETLLALPLENGSRNWIEDYGNDEKYSCSAEWAYIVGDNDFCEKVIKMTKKYLFWGGMTEYSYWAPNLGKVWETLETAKDGLKTIGRREEFSSFREISKDEYIRKMTISEFIRTRADSIRSFRRDNPQTYSLLEDAFAKYVLTLNQNEIVYVAGEGKKDMSYWNYWLGNKEWPNFQIKYTITLSINDLTTTCNGVSNNYQGETKYIFYNQKLPYNCAKYALVNIPNNLIEPSFDIEPTTNYKYHYKMIDNFCETIDIYSYVFKIKRKKGKFVMVSGNEEVWNHCQTQTMNNELELFRQGENTFHCRILKFTCGQYERYSLVTDASIVQYQQPYIRCKLFNIVE
ncbi:MAG: hypothetical protein IKZ99_01170 [Salinivirgaceae bacterium]|nr:hypothetical protein [Salinivirgaceae bacterium]